MTTTRNTDGNAQATAPLAHIESAADTSASKGLVLGMENAAATPLGFSVFIDRDQYLQLDDVVHARSPLPPGGPVDSVDFYGVVDEVRAVQEGVRFDSDVSLASEGLLPAEPAVTAHVAVTRVEPEIFVPPRPGQPVSLARGKARDRALFFDQMAERVPFGLSRDGERIYANLEFLNGTRGAHVNISGISGVATKTSYAMFLLHALFTSDTLGAETATTRSLVFNVKGEDLLFLDKPNAQLADEDREDYNRLGLPAEPFRSVSFYAPARRGEPVPETGSRVEGVTGFYWTLREFCAERYLRFLFADADDERSQLGLVVQQVEAQLALAARASSSIETPTIKIEGEVIADFDELVKAIGQMTDPEEGGTWAGRAAAGTVQAFLRRLDAAKPYVGHLIRGQASEDSSKHVIDTDRAQVTVVDIHRLHDRAQRFVVGVMLKREFERKEASGSPRPLMLVALDELNKYAPREGRSPIKDVLLDIAERGRSLGIVLIGAQQTASEVEPRVVANCAYRVAGRLDAAEAQRSEYGFLTPAARARASLLKPGSMVLAQPEIPVPLLLRFPHPAWATRKSEVAEDPVDYSKYKLSD
ncbi:MAG: ATP-binding protein [Chloroflexi bacterium]|nr:ATP-binding protein [Chloroflexota bacterium]